MASKKKTPRGDATPVKQYDGKFMPRQYGPQQNFPQAKKKKKKRRYVAWWLLYFLLLITTFTT